MKHFFKSAFMLAAVAAMSSCSSETELEAPNQAKDITVNVATETLSRAGVETIEGYELMCIMQLIDEAGNTVGQQVTNSAATGSTSFTISAEAQENGAVQALFWAEYQPTAEGATKVYNTADLKAVSYNTTAFNLNDSKAIAACDAFAGKLSELSENANVTLTRPFVKVTFEPKNPEMAEKCTSLEVAYKTPASYSVLDGKTTEKVDVTYTDAEFVYTETPWFATYIFGTQDKTTFDEDINMSLAGGRVLNYTIPAGKIPTDPNYLVKLTGELSLNVSDINVNVSIDPIFENDGSKPVPMEVGSYVNAQGQAVRNAEDAVAIVFAMGALEGDAIDAYPAEFAGKTIKAYAVALNNITPARLSFGPDFITGLVEQDAKNGSQLDLLGNDLVKNTPIALKWAEWSAANTTSGNVTAWYVPSLNQLSYWLGMLAPSNKGAEATGSEAFKALFPTSNIFDREVIATVNYLSANINNQGNPSVVRMNVTGETYNWQAAAVNVSAQANQSALVRPMFTIFE